MVSRGPSRRQVSKTKTIVVGSALALLTAVLIVIFVVRLASSPGGKVQLGDPVFEVGQVRVLAPEIDRQGPLLFQALNGNRDIFVQHIGDDAKTGWLAFEAHGPGQPRTCDLKWQQKQGVFVDECSQATFPVDGRGLTHYATQVNRKKKGGLTLFVDLRAPLPN